MLEDACDDPQVDFVFAQLHHPYRSELWLDGELDYTGEVIAQVVGGLDVAAEHHGVEAVRDPVLEHDRRCVEFLIILGTGKGFETPGETAQLPG